MGPSERVVVKDVLIYCILSWLYTTGLNGLLGSLLLEFFRLGCLLFFSRISSTVFRILVM